MIRTGGQIRAARALLSWSRQELAVAAQLHVNSIAYWEQRDEIASGVWKEPFACGRIRDALNGAGVEFLTHPAPGVRLCAKPTIKQHHARARARMSWGLTGVANGPDKIRSKTQSEVGITRSAGAARLCGAMTRTGFSCRRKGIGNGGRCANHGGKSTGPRTQAGRKRIAIAQRKRWREHRTRQRE